MHDLRKTQNWLGDSAKAEWLGSGSVLMGFPQTGRAFKCVLNFLLRTGWQHLCLGKGATD